MVWATYTLEVDWDGAGTFGSSADITSDVQRLEWSHGRDDAPSGQLHALLKNTSNKYNSFNGASPLTGSILPGREVRIRAKSGNFPYTFPIFFDRTIWRGFLDRVKPQPDVRGDDKAILTAIGPLGYINQRQVRVALQANILSGTAVIQVLNDANWGTGTGKRAVDAGKTTFTRWWVDGALPVGALTEIADSELGIIRETPTGGIAYEDRHHRLTSPHTTAQVVYSDSGSGSGTVSYIRIEQADLLRNIYDRVETQVQLYSTSTSTILWTLSESGTDSPAIEPAATRTWWANYPNPSSPIDAMAADSWTTPVATTDYIGNSQADGAGTVLTGSLTLSVDKFSNAMKIQVTNNATGTAYMIPLQARGVALLAKNPVTIIEENTTSQGTYGRRTWPTPGRFVPDTSEAEDYGRYILAIYDSPNPFLSLTVHVNTSSHHQAEALTRQISDRVKVIATGSAGLGIAQDFLVEAIRHRIFNDKTHFMEVDCSPATAFGGFWVLGIGILGTTIRSAKFGY